MRRSETAEYRDGAEARRRGEAKETNPFLMPRNRSLWNSGWVSADRQMRATAIRADVVEVLVVETMREQGAVRTFLTVPCADYEAYTKLPLLVEFDGKRFARSGWNSDRGHGYYNDCVAGLAIAVR